VARVSRISSAVFVHTKGLGFLFQPLVHWRSTRALAGDSRYSPAMSRTFSMNCGSVLSFHVSVR
jgi:hypothetical protein